MRAGLSQTGRLGQELKINPRLYQAMDMLYMPLLDLQQHLKQEFLTNPFLELEEDEELEQEETVAPDGVVTPEPVAEFIEPIEERQVAAEESETDWERLIEEGYESNADSGEEQEQRDPFDRVGAAATGIQELLRDQLSYLSLPPRQALLALEFVGNVADDGYLTASLAEILEGINETVARAAEERGLVGETLPLYTMGEAEEMLAVMQRLEPAGVCARDLRECLVLQLRAAGREGSLAARLVQEFFDELIAHRWSDVARNLGVSQLEVQHAADEVAKLNPKPGSGEGDGRSNYVIPDFVVEKVAGKYLVFINDGELPRLRLGRAYLDIVRDKKKFNAESKDFIANKLNAAQWLIQAIEQRRQTMLKVMNFIVEHQREYFEKGVQCLKPLTLREVADGIGMHESTVSRVTNDKYAQTPRGVLPLKFFFSSGLATVDGDDVSARGIRATIETLVKQEDPKRPLTDQAIVALLGRDGVQIARRTVAKYRDQLGVLSARMRKRV